MPILAALVSGIIFGAGLTVAQMTNPRKILDFLDLAAIASGRWDPTLLTVFAGALLVMFVAFRLQAGRAAPLFAPAWHLPTRRDIDRPLVLGSGLFGIGWGLSGLCPGPAVAALPLVARERAGAALLFFAAMLLGVWLANITGLSGAPREKVGV